MNVVIRSVVSAAKKQPEEHGQLSTKRVAAEKKVAAGVAKRKEGAPRAKAGEREGAGKKGSALATMADTRVYRCGKRVDCS